MKTITYDELKKLKNNNEKFTLINVLSKGDFERANILGSINIPNEQPDFVQAVEKAAGDKTAKIVTYCASFDCQASKNAASKLDAAGFTNVFAYEGGIKEWQEKTGASKAAA